MTLFLVYTTHYESRLQAIRLHQIPLFLFSHAETSCSLSLTENQTEQNETTTQKQKAIHYSSQIVAEK